MKMLIISRRWEVLLAVYKAVLTTTIRLHFDGHSTAIRPRDDLRYDRRPACMRAANRTEAQINKQVSHSCDCGYQASGLGCAASLWP